jgi:hypothetical protein
MFNAVNLGRLWWKRETKKHGEIVKQLVDKVRRHKVIVLRRLFSQLDNVGSKLPLNNSVKRIEKNLDDLGFETVNSDDEESNEISELSEEEVV